MFRADRVTRVGGPDPCDACRSRKIRCDRQTPCSNCKTAKLNCVSTELPSPRRKRIHLSDEHNSDISEIKHGIEKIWSHLHSQNVSPELPKRRTTPDFMTEASCSMAPSLNRDLWPPFEGSSSFRTVSQTMMEELGGGLPFSNQQSLNPDSTLSSSNKSGLTKSLQSTHMPLLPGHKVLRVLEAAGGTPNVLDEFPFINLDELSLIFQRLYFPVKGFSISDLITAHSCMFFLVRDLDKKLVENFGFEPGQTQQMLSQCSSFLAHVTSELPLLHQPTFEGIRALLLLTSVLLETDRFATASNLTSIICRLCLDAGYHRLQSSDTREGARQGRLIFWRVYVLDRGFALSLGRAPGIPDFETILDRIVPGEIAASKAVYFNGWIEFAEIQGEIYEKFYSPRGQRSDAATKIISAQSFAERLILLSMSMPADGEGLNTNLKWCGEITINAMLTLIYYAVEGDQYRDTKDKSCLESLLYARNALDKLNEAWAVLGDEQENRQSASFLVWSVQFSPFAPFVVVLKHAFYYGHEADMLRLRKAVAVMKTTANISSCIAQLHSICDKLLCLTEDHLKDLRQTEVSADSSDKPTPFTGDHEFVAVLEDTEHIPLFMDSWETFLHVQD